MAQKLLVIETSTGKPILIDVPSFGAPKIINYDVPAGGQQNFAVPTPINAQSVIEVLKNGLEIREGTDWNRDLANQRISTIENQTEETWIKIKVY